MKSNLLLIGLPGSGKTTIGKALSELLQRPFIDMDELIEASTGQTIPTLFQQGEGYFRDRETEAVEVLSTRRHTIISAGGGLVKRPVNMELLRPNATVIFIDRSVNDILSDLDVSGRPLLRQNRDHLHQLAMERDPLYRQAADYIVPNLGPLDRVLEQILTIVEQKPEEDPDQYTQEESI